MRVGILTFHFALNYGAVFQAYALKEVFAKMGHESDVINYRPLNMRTSWNFAEYCKLIKDGPSKKKQSSIVRSLIAFILRRVFYARYLIFEYNGLKKKYEVFDEFVNGYLCKDRTIIEDPSELKLLKQYDVIVCGSDQIWNPNITKGFDPSYFGYGFSAGIKKFSYAASVGDLSIVSRTKDKEKEFLKLLGNFDFISVRENNLCEFLRGRNINSTCVLDPTLLLGCDDYNKILSSHPVNEDYIFVYCLKYDKLIFQVAEKLSSKYKCKIIAVSGTKTGGKKLICDLPPCDFLLLLKNAKAVVTNSFHGTALSIIFNRDFFTVLPPKRKDRIFNLLNKLGLEKQIISSINDLTNNTQMDFTVIEKKLEVHRSYSMQFLKESVK